MTLLLALLYPLAVQYERGGWWRVLAPITFIALVVDVIANYTELAIAMWDFPRRGEWTFSQRLVRLTGSHGWRGKVAREIAHWLNRIAPSGRHI